MGVVLLITYHYPPRPGIGSVRPSGLAKYLRRFGWEPIILTPQLPEGSRPSARVIQTRYRDVLGDWKAKLGLDPISGLHEQFQLSVSIDPRTKCFHTRAIDCVKSIIAYPDPMKGWVPFAVEAVRELGRNEKIDAILSSAPPVTCHLIGRRAKEILKCPWVADFRDLWTQNHHYSYGRIRHAVEARLERKTIRPADALVTVSAPLAEVLRREFNDRPVRWITNGFDPEEFQSEAPQLTETLSITYTGQVYQGKQDPGLLLKVIADLFREGTLCQAEIRVRFYGPTRPWLHAMVQRYGLGGTVEIHGLESRDATLKHQRESQLLLLLNWNDPSETGVYTGKMFEYLGAKRPVLAIGDPPGVVAALLEETKAGTHVGSEAQLRAFLIEAHEEFRRVGCVSYTGDTSVIKRYTHLEMARKFATVLNMVTGEGQNER